MPVIRSADAAVHQAHGSTFSSFVAPSRGSAQLCAWQLNVPAGLRGVAHRPTREEVLLLLEGELTVTLDGIATVLAAGDVVLVPASGEHRYIDCASPEVRIGACCSKEVGGIGTWILIP